MAHLSTLASWQWLAVCGPACMWCGLGQGAAYAGYGQPMSSSQPVGEALEQSQQLTQQSSFQGSAASNAGPGTSGGNTGAGSITGQPAAGYAGQPAPPAAAAQQQQAFNPNSRLAPTNYDYSVPSLYSASF